MLYSLFIFFLTILFAKWWIDSSPASGKHTRWIFIFGTIGLMGYGLFVSCIDRKRINYPLARGCANVANICLTITMYLIMHNLRKIRKEEPGFIKPKSWTLKQVFCGVHIIGFTAGLLMYLGYLDIEYKPIIEYTIVISTTLFLWTFAKDFKKFKMDIDLPQDEQEECQNPIQEVGYGYSQQPVVMMREERRPAAVNFL